MITFGDIELTQEEFEKMLKENKDLDIEVKIKPEPMKKLNYRFGEGVPKACDEIASTMDQFNQSDVARAAIAIGLNEIKKSMKDGNAVARIHIGKIRHDFL